VLFRTRATLVVIDRNLEGWAGSRMVLRAANTGATQLKPC
jgi:hypothetical protein